MYMYVYSAGARPRRQYGSTRRQSPDPLFERRFIEQDPIHKQYQRNNHFSGNIFSDSTERANVNDNSLRDRAQFHELPSARQQPGNFRRPQFVARNTMTGSDTRPSHRSGSRSTVTDTQDLRSHSRNQITHSSGSRSTPTQICNGWHCTNITGKLFCCGKHNYCEAVIELEAR